MQDEPADYDQSAQRAAGLVLPDDLLPRAFKDRDAIERRQALLATRPAHMVALVDHVAELRRVRPDWQVPGFDPAGGGVEARALFLLEKPGPKTSANGGSGFLSMNNDNPTAEAVYRFAHLRNRLPMHWCLFANVIPWWDGTTRISPEQRRLAVGALAGLLPLLPRLQAIVLVGGTARKVWSASGLQSPEATTIWESDHPSPNVRAAYPLRWAAIPSRWPTRTALLRQRDPSQDASASRPT